MVCDFIERGGDAGGAARAVRQGGLARLRLRARPRAGRHRQPDHDALGRVAGDRRGGRAGAWRGATATTARRALPVVRHHLLRDPGAAGRGRGPARRAARPHGRGRRIQLQQHLPSRRAGPLARRAGLPHRGRRRSGPRDRHDSPPADRRPRTRRWPRAGWATPGSSASPPAPRLRTTRSARPWRASAARPAVDLRGSRCVRR